MKQSILYALFSALITAAFITGAPAFGQTPTPGEVRTYVSVVETADLDVRTPEGERRLQQRLARAAREVCGTASDADVRGKNAVRQCRNDAIAHASQRRDELLAAAGRGAQIAVTAAR